jgi:hypothetical protein
LKVKNKNKPKEELKSILQIPKDPTPVILIGCGESIDNLNLGALNRQEKYNTCTISDAIKVLKQPTYAFQYHWRGAWRCHQELDKAKYLITTYKVLNDFKRVGKEEWYNIIKEQENAYFFQSNHVKWDVIREGKFDLQISEPKLQNHEGSVVGVIHFLCGYLGVRNIKYIGFDGGVNPGKTSYGSKVHHGRKPSKIQGAAKDYEKSWQAVLKMLEYYPHVMFKPLDEFLRKGK